MEPVAHIGSGKYSHACAGKGLCTTMYSKKRPRAHWIKFGNHLLQKAFSMREALNKAGFVVGQ